MRRDLYNYDLDACVATSTADDGQGEPGERTGGIRRLGFSRARATASSDHPTVLPGRRTKGRNTEPLPTARSTGLLRPLS